MIAEEERHEDDRVVIGEEESTTNEESTHNEDGQAYQELAELLSGLQRRTYDWLDLGKSLCCRLLEAFRTDPDLLRRWARTNTVVDSASIEPHFFDDEYETLEVERFYGILARSLAEFCSLRDLEFRFRDSSSGYLASSLFLENIRQLTSFKLIIDAPTGPPDPDRVDRSLANHPSLERLHVCYTQYGGSDLRLQNPFPNSLASLPKLSCVEFSGYLFNKPRKPAVLTGFRPIANDSFPSNLWNIRFQGLILDGQFNAALSKTIASSPKLFSLHIQPMRNDGREL